VERKSTVLIVFFSLVVISAVAWKYYDFVLQANYLVHDVIECDPSLESCFKWDCDTSDPECDVEPYAKIEKLATNISCIDGACEPLQCEEDEADCSVTYCSMETLEEEEICIQTVVVEEPDDSLEETVEQSVEE
jgi:hypothetical protein